MTTYSRRDFLVKSGAAVAGGAALLALPKPSAASGADFPPADRVLSGNESFPDGFTVPAGETWEFDPNQTTTVESKGNVIVRGKLRMRPTDASIVHTLRFVDVDESDFSGGGMNVKDSDVGLWVMGFGRLRIVGSRKAGWIRDETPHGWSDDDPVVVAPNERGKSDPEDFTETTWGAVDRPAPVSIGGDSFNTEIMNLKRNVIIEGTPNGHAHVLIRSSVRQIIKFAAFRHLGVEGATGRYPVHFHHCGDGSRRSVIKGVVVMRSGHRAFVPHGSHGIRFADCVAYDVKDNPYWWDKREYDEEHKVDRSQAGDSHDVIWNKCVAARVVKGSGVGFLAGFTLGGGRNNRTSHCVAVGIKGSNDAAGYEWPSQANKAPNAWVFRDNVAHNNRGNGVYIWQNSGSPHVNENTVFYHNRSAAILHGAYGNKYQWNGVKILGGETAIRLYASTKAVEDKHVGDPDKAQETQRWRDIYIEGAETALAISHSKGGDGETPVVFENFEVVDCNNVVKRTTNKTDKKARLVDIIDPLVDGGNMTPNMVDISGAHRDSLIRVVNRDGSAFAVDADGTAETIPPFDS